MRFEATTRDSLSGLRVEPGKTIGLVGALGGGLTRLGLSMLAEPSQRAAVAVVDVRGWVSPLAAYELGIEPSHLVVVRSTDRYTWVQVVAALLEGMQAVYAEVPAGVSDAHLRRLAALTRSRRGVLLLRPLEGRLPAGISHLTLQSEAVTWSGAEAGHGKLESRRIDVRAWGKGVAGTERIYEIEDNGNHPLRLVAGVVAPAAGRVAG